MRDSGVQKRALADATGPHNTVRREASMFAITISRSASRPKKKGELAVQRNGISPVYGLSCMQETFAALEAAGLRPLSTAT